MTAHIPGFNCEYILKGKKSNLSKIIKKDFFDIIHLHHGSKFPYEDLGKAILDHGNYLISMHDFHPICPKFNLLTPTKRMCNLHECSTTCHFDSEYIKKFRGITKELLNNAKRLISFSKTTQTYFEKAIGKGFSWTNTPHGTSIQKNTKDLLVAKPSLSNPLKIVFLGNINEHKGLDLLEELIKKHKLPNGILLEWHVVGKSFCKMPKYVHQHGPYEKNNLPDLFEKISPHLVMILSIWPETYCYTLDEALNQQVPAIVTPFGAIAERTKANNSGWILKEVNVKSAFELLAHLSDNWTEYEEIRSKVKKLNLLSNKEESILYNELYQEISQKAQKYRFKPFFEYLRENKQKSFEKNSTYNWLKKITPYFPLWAKNLAKKFIHK